MSLRAVFDGHLPIEAQFDVRSSCFVQPMGYGFEQSRVDGSYRPSAAACAMGSFCVASR